MHAVDLTPVRLHAVRENGDRGGGGGLIGDDELDGIEDDLASNEEWEECASYSIRALETPQCNRRKQEGAGTELRVQDGGENANEGDYDCQEGHHGRCGANRRAPRAAESLHRAYYGLFTEESEMRRRDHTGQVHVVILLRRCQTRFNLDFFWLLATPESQTALWSFARSELKK